MGTEAMTIDARDVVGWLRQQGHQRSAALVHELMAERDTWRARAEQAEVADAIEPRAVSIEVAAKAMDITYDYLHNLCNNGEFPYVPMGRRKLIRVATIDAWLADRETATSGKGEQ